MSEVDPVIKKDDDSVTRRSERVSLQTKVLLTLWTLANKDSFREIGDRFGLNRGSAHHYFVQVCQLFG